MYGLELDIATGTGGNKLGAPTATPRPIAPRLVPAAEGAAAVYDTHPGFTLHAKHTAKLAATARGAAGQAGMGVNWYLGGRNGCGVYAYTPPGKSGDLRLGSYLRDVVGLEVPVAVPLGTILFVAAAPGDDGAAPEWVLPMPSVVADAIAPSAVPADYLTTGVLAAPATHPWAGGAYEGVTPPLPTYGAARAWLRQYTTALAGAGAGDPQVVVQAPVTTGRGVEVPYTATYNA